MHRSVHLISWSYSKLFAVSGKRISQNEGKLVAIEIIRTDHGDNSELAIGPALIFDQSSKCKFLHSNILLLCQ